MILSHYLNGEIDSLRNRPPRPPISEAEAAIAQPVSAFAECDTNNPDVVVQSKTFQAKTFQAAEVSIDEDLFYVRPTLDMVEVFDSDSDIEARASQQEATRAISNEAPSALNSEPSSNVNVNNSTSVEEPSTNASCATDEPVTECCMCCSCYDNVESPELTVETPSESTSNVNAESTSNVNEPQPQQTEPMATEPVVTEPMDIETAYISDSEYESDVPTVETETIDHTNVETNDHTNVEITEPTNVEENVESESTEPTNVETYTPTSSKPKPTPEQVEANIALLEELFGATYERPDTNDTNNAINTNNTNNTNSANIDIDPELADLLDPNNEENRANDSPTNYDKYFNYDGYDSDFSEVTDDAYYDSDDSIELPPEKGANWKVTKTSDANYNEIRVKRTMKCSEPNRNSTKLLEVSTMIVDGVRIDRVKQVLHEINENDERSLVRVDDGVEESDSDEQQPTVEITELEDDDDESQHTVRIEPASPVIDMGSPDTADISWEDELYISDEGEEGDCDGSKPSTSKSTKPSKPSSPSKPSNESTSKPKTVQTKITQFTIDFELERSNSSSVPSDDVDKARKILSDSEFDSEVENFNDKQKAQSVSSDSVVDVTMDNLQSIELSDDEDVQIQTTTTPSPLKRRRSKDFDMDTELTTFVDSCVDSNEMFKPVPLYPDGSPKRPRLEDGVGNNVGSNVCSSVSERVDEENVTTSVVESNENEKHVSEMDTVEYESESENEVEDEDEPMREPECESENEVEDELMREPEREPERESENEVEDESESDSEHESNRESESESEREYESDDEGSEDERVERNGSKFVESECVEDGSEPESECECEYPESEHEDESEHEPQHEDESEHENASDCENESERENASERENESEQEDMYEVETEPEQEPEPESVPEQFVPEPSIPEQSTPNPEQPTSTVKSNIESSVSYKRFLERMDSSNLNSQKNWSSYFDDTVEQRASTSTPKKSKSKKQKRINVTKTRVAVKELAKSNNWSKLKKLVKEFKAIEARLADIDDSDEVLLCKLERRRERILRKFKSTSGVSIRVGSLLEKLTMNLPRHLVDYREALEACILNNSRKSLKLPTVETVKRALCLSQNDAVELLKCCIESLQKINGRDEDDDDDVDEADEDADVEDEL